ncbi:MAG: winged helix-turn-helix transcriptional regulator [Promethearchaeota archaeon]
MGLFVRRIREEIYSSPSTLPEHSKKVVLLDTIDKKLILELDENCRATFQELAHKLGMTANAVRKRVTKLVEQGVIEEFVVIMRPAMTGAEFLLALLHTDGLEDDEALLKEMGDYPGVVQTGLIASVKGRTYLVFAEYIGAAGLMDLRKFLCGLESVQEVELHTLLRQKGTKIELSKLHLRVLRQLIEDARMSITDIANNTGLSAKRVRRALSDITESGAFWLAARWNLSAGEDTEFYARIEIDERVADREAVDEYLRSNHPSEYWLSFHSAIEPTVFAKFVTEHFRESDEIAKALKNAPFVKSIDVLICYPVYKFERLSQLMLKEKLTEAGLWP